MSEQPLRPEGNELAAWQAYWDALGMQWRKEPEIDEARKAEISQLRERPGDTPFRDIVLSRSDVEWLLETHESEGIAGPVRSPKVGIAVDEFRQGPNLSYAHLRADLSGLPLSGANLASADLTNAPLQGTELYDANLQEAVLAGANLERANLGGANLQDADLSNANLQGAHLTKATLAGADFSKAHLEGVFLFRAHLQEVELSDAHLEGADLRHAHLEGAYLIRAHLKRADLRDAHLDGAHLSEADLEGANLTGASLQGADVRGANLQKKANLSNADLRRADLRDAHLEGGRLTKANLEEADLRNAHLEGADLSQANLEGADLRDAHLQGGDLRLAFLDLGTMLHGITLGQCPSDSIRVADIRWGGANLAVVNNGDGIPWSGVQRLQDELDEDPHTAMRAYTQLVTALRDQGLAGEANRFAYRAQVLRLQQAWRQVRAGRLNLLGPALGLSALWGLAGFGYRPSRSLGWWMLLVLVGSVAFYFIDQIGCLCWPGGLPTGDGAWSALIASINACHGRGIFFSGTDSGAPTMAQGAVASVLAVFGLVIEATLIATFTQRFFGR